MFGNLSHVAHLGRIIQGMDGNRNLLPWILSGLSIATAAIAITAGSIKTTGFIERTSASAPATQPVPLPSTAQMVAPVSSTPSPSTAYAEPSPAAPAPAAETTMPPEEVAAAQEAPGNQIWACTTNGIKTFSNNPCGEKSALLDVGPVNTMEATRVPPSAHQYMPDPHYAPDYPPQETPEQSDEVYSTYGVGVGLVPHYVRKRPKPVYPSQHHRGPQPRNY
jgi:hypothetical protein